MRLLPYGDGALLVEPEDPATLLGLAAALAGSPGVLEVVPAARTLLVRAEPADLEAVGRRVETLAERVSAARPDGAAGAGEVAGADEVVLEVHYDGADLDTTAAELGLDAADLVRRHVEASYVVAFCGFVPGFAYLTGLPAALHAPRLAEPRTRVPAGAVGLAGEFTGVYPRPSPGGWRLIGHTDAPLWDLGRTPPALLPPGTRVRFRAA